MLSTLDTMKLCLFPFTNITVEATIFIVYQHGDYFSFSLHLFIFEGDNITQKALYTQLDTTP